MFFDGDSTDAQSLASVHVFDDHAIEDGDDPIMLNLSLPMHGVAEPRGEHLLATMRRDDALSTSSNTILPNQVDYAPAMIAWLGIAQEHDH